MEIKATLQKPYDEAQKMDFIVEQNHKKGYELKETETAMEAWGYTEEETAHNQKQFLLIQLESQTGLIRPLRENILAEGSAYAEYTKAKAREIEDLAQELRKDTIGA